MAGNYCDLLGGECHTLAERDSRHALERVFHCGECYESVQVTGVTCPKCVHKKRKPVIGVVALVRDNEGRFLVSERKSGKMQGWYGAPGGHLEWMETFEEAAVRELKEETGLSVSRSDCEVVGVDQHYDSSEDHHWVVVFVLARHWSGKPARPEGDKHGPWEWYFGDKLPEKTLQPLVSIARKLGP